MITSSHHSLSALFKPITTAWSCVSKRNLITAIHTFRHVLCLASSSSSISLLSVSFPFFLQDHRPLNRAVIGETLGSLVWPGKRHTHTHTRVCMCARAL